MSIFSQAKSSCQKTVFFKAFIVSKSRPRGMINYHRPMFSLQTSTVSNLTPMNAWSISFAAHARLSQQSIFASQCSFVFFSCLLLALYYAFGRISYPAISVATFPSSSTLRPAPRVQHIFPFHVPSSPERKQTSSLHASYYLLFPHPSEFVDCPT